MIPAIALTAVIAVMAVELRISQRNERRLRQEGASEPRDDVYRGLRLVYPTCFIAMAAEGWWRASPAKTLVVAGAAVWVASKALKAWVIISLGPDWSFHVLVRRRHVLVTRGPYRFVRHPNYIAIMGEITGMALLVAAPVSGVVSLAAMGVLLMRRIAVEERVLGLRT